MEEETLTDLITELQQLNIRQVEVLSRIERLTELQATEGISVARNNVNGFRIGDRVRITNKVKKPAAWPREQTWSESEFRSATVTRVTRLQIHFVTDNGIKTWRAPNNLERITS
jgi:hypothetical protein